MLDSRAFYEPFGDYRLEPTGDYTDQGYTGHLGNNSGSNDIGLIYMNARFYVPGIGRFASADTIVPDPANPQSFNRYSYVRNNPVNFTDPSGHSECGVGHYHCAGDGLPNSRYFFSSYGGGTYFDMAHLNGGKVMAEIIFANMREAINNGGGEFTLTRRQTVLIFGESITAASYSSTYWVSGDISDDQFKAVALAIYMDFEFGFEQWQSTIPIGNGRQSAFSIEDFPSDFVGFFAAANDLSIEEALYMLGSVSGASEGNIPKSQCVGPVCDDLTVKNIDFSGFTPKVLVDGTWQNVPWPETMQMTPLNDSSLWQFRGDSSCLGQSFICADHSFLFANPLGE